MEKEEGSFSVLINYVRPVNFDLICDKFSEYFNIKKEDCKQILKVAPVKFVDGLSKKDVRNIKSKLLELSKYGVEFEITPQDIKNLPKVIWPFKVNFSSYSGDLITNIDFKWNGFAFACPSCGEVITVRPVGRKAKDRTIVEVVKEEVKTKRVVEKKETPPQKPPTKKVVSEKVADDLKIEEPIALDEPLLEPLEPIEAENVSQAEEPEIIEPLEPLEPLIADKQKESDTVELIPIDEETKSAPKKPEKKEIKKPPIKKAEISEATTQKVIRKDYDEQSPASKPESSKQTPIKKGEGKKEEEGEVLYSVFLNKISDASQREKAAKLLSELKGISLMEAKQLVNRVLIPVLKNVTKDEADACLQKFKKISIDGHITKR